MERVEQYVLNVTAQKKYKYSTGKFLYYTDIGSIHKDKWK